MAHKLLTAHGLIRKFLFVIQFIRTKTCSIATEPTEIKFTSCWFLVCLEQLSLGGEGGRVTEGPYTLPLMVSIQSKKPVLIWAKVP